MLTGEYLIPFKYFYKHSSLKFGVGLSYVFPKYYDFGDDGFLVSDSNLVFSYEYIPIYFTVQAPLKDLGGLFVKSNIGYNAFFVVRSLDSSELDSKKAGIYYGLSLGYEFPKGFIVDVEYNVYKGEIKSGIKMDSMYSNITCNVGYKFKI
jgi:hypothetical protein